jgi:hypothetical protein
MTTRPALRWVVAAAVTIAAFTAATCICGALVLTMHDLAARWGIAGALGVAVAALAALWGHSYATTEPSHDLRPEATRPSLPAQAPASGEGETRNTIRGGTFQGPVIQGRDVGPLNLNLDLNRPAPHTDPTHSSHPMSGQE